MCPKLPCRPVLKSYSKLVSFSVKPRMRSTQKSSQPVSIRPSRVELNESRLSPQNLEVAIRSIHQDGLVMIEDVIPHKPLDYLNRKMVADGFTLQARKNDGPYNYNRGNIQQDPPPVRQYFDKNIFLNHIVTQVTSTMLGSKPKWTFCSGNTAMPPTPETPPSSQPVHSDADFEHPKHPFALVVNVPLITMTPENGSTEVWLGTHADTGLDVQEGRHGERSSGRIKSAALENQRAVRPPCQPVVPKGAVVIRDLRLWHCGVGNQTEDVRVMLAMIHFAPWYRNPMKLELAEDVKEIVEKETALEIPVNWIPREQALHRYLNRGFGNSYDFGQSP